MCKLKIPLSALSPGTGTIVTHGDKRIFLCRSGDTIRAMSEWCPHQKMSLEGARVRRGSVICPHHGARFDLESGETQTPLTTNSLKFYAVEVIGDQIEIEVE